MSTDTTPPAELIDRLMEQSQVFASAWSLVGGQFDNGQMLGVAEEARAELRASIAAALARAPAEPKWPERCAYDPSIGRAYSNGWNECLSDCKRAFDEHVLAAQSPAPVAPQTQTDP